MLEQEKLSRNEVLKELTINDETLSLYEHGLGINVEQDSGTLDTFTKDDLQLIRTFHKLREAGLTYNEINLLGDFSEVLKNVDLKDLGEVRNLLKLSPVFRLKQSLNLARQELDSLRTKVKELENVLEEAVKSKSNNSVFEAELDANKKTISSLDRKLSETLLQKTQLEAQLAMYKEGKDLLLQIKGKKPKELYQAIAQKELELSETKKKNEQLLEELQKSTEELHELHEKLQLQEEETTEQAQEIEERYQEQITSLRAQIEGLIDKKQKEWDALFARLNEQRKKEILTLQSKHEQDIFNHKQKIKQQAEEINEFRAHKNPLLALSRIVDKLR